MNVMRKLPESGGGRGGKGKKKNCGGAARDEI